MIYEYECKFGRLGHCKSAVTGGRFDVVKPMSRIGIEEQCPHCHSIACRVWSHNAGRVSVFKEEFYPAFGRVIKSKRDLRNEISRVKGETGKEMVEVGNDRSVERVEHKVDHNRACQELKRAWRN